jgi:hypothetical protein
MNNNRAHRVSSRRSVDATISRQTRAHDFHLHLGIGIFYPPTNNPPSLIFVLPGVARRMWTHTPHLPRPKFGHHRLQNANGMQSSPHIRLIHRNRYQSTIGALNCFWRICRCVDTRAAPEGSACFNRRVTNVSILLAVTSTVLRSVP